MTDTEQLRISFFEAVENDIKSVLFMLGKRIEGFDINTVDKFGKTALMNACRYGYKKMVEILIKHGADINVIDNYGNTALMYACMYRRKEIPKFLVEAGAVISINCEVNIEISKYLKSITSNAKHRRINYLNNSTRDNIS